MIGSVRYKIDAGVARITLAAAGSGNALNSNSISELHHALAQAEADEKCRAIVLCAEGASFCSGLDVSAALDNCATRDPRIFPMFVDCLQALSHSSRPVIAEIMGAVRGGGVGLVAACDLVISSETATFMLPEVVIGMIPALIAPFLLRRLTLAQMRYMTLSSRSIAAREANSLGLVDEVVPGPLNAVKTAVGKQLRRILRSSPQALARSKQYFDRLDPQELSQQKTLALKELESWMESPGVLDGLRSFANGFSPPWFAKPEEMQSADGPGPITRPLQQVRKTNAGNDQVELLARRDIQARDK